MKRQIEQCEGCYGPLGDMLDADPELLTGDLDITWVLCHTHEQESINTLPFDTYDDYNY